MHCSSWKSSLPVLLLKWSFSQHRHKRVKYTISDCNKSQTLFLTTNLFIFWLTAVCVSVKNTATPEISCSFSKHTNSSHDPAPIISLPSQRGLNHNGFSSREEMTASDSSAPSFTDQPIFFRLVLLKSCWISGLSTSKHFVLLTGSLDLPPRFQYVWIIMENTCQWSRYVVREG